MDNFERKYSKFQRFFVDPDREFTLLNQNKFPLKRGVKFINLSEYNEAFVICSFEPDGPMVYRESLLLQAVELTTIHKKCEKDNVNCLYHLKFWKTQANGNLLFQDRNIRLIIFHDGTNFSFERDNCYLFERQFSTSNSTLVPLYNTTKKQFTGNLPSWVSH